MSEQLYTQRHDNVCGVIHWYICRNFNIPVPQNSWTHEPKAIIENKNIMLTYNLMIPSSVNIENTATGHSTQIQGKEDSIPKDFGRKNK